MSTKYSPRSVRMSNKNIIDLCGGKATPLRRQQVDHPEGHTIHLTKAQHKMLDRFKVSSQKIITLPAFSKHQMTHNIQAGGVFSDLIDKFKDIVKEHGHNVVNTVANKVHEVAPGLLEKASDLAGNYIGKENAKKLSKVFEGYVHSGIATAHNSAHDALSKRGYGMSQQTLFPANQKPFKKRK